MPVQRAPGLPALPPIAAHDPIGAVRRAAARALAKLQAVTHAFLGLPPSTIRWDESATYGAMVREYDASGATIASYVFANGDPISTQRGSSRSSYLLDAQGSVRALSTASATLSDQYAYTALVRPAARPAAACSSTAPPASSAILRPGCTTCGPGIMHRG